MRQNRRFERERFRFAVQRVKAEVREAQDRRGRPGPGERRPPGQPGERHGRERQREQRACVPLALQRERRGGQHNGQHARGERHVPRGAAEESGRAAVCPAEGHRADREQQRFDRDDEPPAVGLVRGQPPERPQCTGQRDPQPAVRDGPELPPRVAREQPDRERRVRECGRRGMVDAVPTHHEQARRARRERAERVARGLPRRAPREHFGDQSEREREARQHRATFGRIEHPAEPVVRADFHRYGPIPDDPVEAEDRGEREQRDRAGLHPRQPLAERDVGKERAGRGGHEQHRQRFRPRERETNRHAHEAAQRDRRADGSQADGRCRAAQHQHAGFHHRHGGQCQRKGERVQPRRDLILRANEVQPPRREERERGQSDEHQERGPALLSNRFFAPTGVIPRQPAERGGTGDHEAQEREPRGGRRGREQLRARRADDGQRQQPAAVDGAGQVFGADQVAPAGAHHAHERRHRREFHRDIERARRALRERVGEE